MKKLGDKAMRRRRRKLRVRKRVVGTPARPRLTVFRSHQNVYAQIVDDLAGRTLVAASTMEGPLREQLSYGGNRPAASAVGARLAEKAIKAGIKKVVFDRNGYAYHGRVKELANARRRMRRTQE